MQNNIVRAEDIERARSEQGVHHPRDRLAATGTDRDPDGVLASLGEHAWNEVDMQGSTPAGSVRASGVFAVTSRELRVQGLRTAEEVAAANPGSTLEEARRAFTARPKQFTARKYEAGQGPHQFVGIRQWEGFPAR